MTGAIKSRVTDISNCQMSLFDNDKTMDKRDIYVEVRGAQWEQSLFKGSKANHIDSIKGLLRSNTNHTNMIQSHVSFETKRKWSKFWNLTGSDLDTHSVFKDNQWPVLDSASGSTEKGFYPLTCADLDSYNIHRAAKRSGNPRQIVINSCILSSK